MVERQRISANARPFNETIVWSSFSSDGVPPSLDHQICPALDIFRNMDLPRSPIFQSTTDGQLQDKQSASMKKLAKKNLPVLFALAMMYTGHSIWERATITRPRKTMLIRQGRNDQEG